MSLHTTMKEQSSSLEQRRIQPNRKAPKFYALMSFIYKQFGELTEIAPHNRTVFHLPAKDILSAIAANLGSTPNQIMKARNALGIRTRRLGRWKNSFWVWKIPTHSPDQVTNLIHSRRMRAIEERRLKAEAEKTEARRPENHPMAVELKSYMLAHGCAVDAKEALDYLYNNCTRSKAVLSRTKRILGIQSIKKLDRWIWVYPSPEVEDWLLTELAKGPQPIDSLTERVQQAGWSFDVLHEVKINMGGIHEIRIRGARCWYDYSVNPDLRSNRREELD